MTTLTAVNDQYSSRGAAGAANVDGGPSGAALWITVSVTALVVSTLLVAGYLEYVALAAAGPIDLQGGLPGLLTRDFQAGVLGTGLTAFGVGLGPVLALKALPGIRVRSWRGPLALFAAGVSTVLCILGLLTTLT